MAGLGLQGMIHVASLGMGMGQQQVPARARQCFHLWEEKGGEFTFRCLYPHTNQVKPQKRAHHRIMESLRLENLSDHQVRPSTSTTIMFTLNHVPKCHIHVFHEHLQGW